MRRVALAPLLSWRQRGMPWQLGVVVSAEYSQACGQTFRVITVVTPTSTKLSANGPYQFFAAFRNNQLDYEQFYPCCR